MSALRFINRLSKISRFSEIGKFQSIILIRSLSNLSFQRHTCLSKSPSSLKIYVLTPQHHRLFSSYPEHVLVKLPNLSPTMTTGTVVSWAKGEGDQIEEGDLMAEIETDKATMSLDASDPGYLAKIISPAGTKDIPVGTPLCIVVEDAADVAAFKDFVADMTVAAPEAPTPVAAPPPPTQPTPPVPPIAATPPPPAAAAPSPASGARVFASPLAKTLASQQGVDLKDVGSGSGPDGRIRAQDIQRLLESQPAMTSAAATPLTVDPAAEFVDIPLSNMRSVIAKRLTASKQSIPHYYLTVEVRMDTIIKLRSEINARLRESQKNSKLSVNDFVIKAAAMACMKVPECNSSWQDTFVRQFNQVDVSVAVATEGGLITPIVKGVERKGLLAINSTVAELAEKARSNKLKPHEFQGGTFTISNLGMFGIKSFTAIINPPQACILAVGGAEKRLVPDDTSETGFSTANVMAVTLCCDHRVVDGAVGAQWLQKFKQHLEEPFSMLL